jgi:hypothetical protein
MNGIFFFVSIFLLAPHPAAPHRRPRGFHLDFNSGVTVGGVRLLRPFLTRSLWQQEGSTSHRIFCPPPPPPHHPLLGARLFCFMFYCACRGAFRGRLGLVC